MPFIGVLLPEKFQYCQEYLLLVDLQTGLFIRAIHAIHWKIFWVHKRPLKAKLTQMPFAVVP